MEFEKMSNWADEVEEEEIRLKIELIAKKPTNYAQALKSKPVNNKPIIAKPEVPVALKESPKRNIKKPRYETVVHSKSNNHGTVDHSKSNNHGTVDHSKSNNKTFGDKTFGDKTFGDKTFGNKTSFDHKSNKHEKKPYIPLNARIVTPIQEKTDPSILEFPKITITEDPLESRVFFLVGLHPDIKTDAGLAKAMSKYATNIEVATIWRNGKTKETKPFGFLLLKTGKDGAAFQEKEGQMVEEKILGSVRDITVRDVKPEEDPTSLTLYNWSNRTVVDAFLLFSKICILEKENFVKRGNTVVIQFPDVYTTTVALLLYNVKDDKEKTLSLRFSILKD